MANVRAKLRIALRTGWSSGHILNVDPAALEGDDSLYRGSAVLGSLRAAASGWYSEADEYVAWIVLRCAMFICLMISKQMRETDHAFVREALPGVLSDLQSRLLLEGGSD